MKTSELSGIALDYAVSLIEGDIKYGVHDWREQRRHTVNSNDEYVFRYHQSWNQAGPIIERENIHLKPTHNNTQWRSHTYDGKGEGVQNTVFGPTPLIAAMRCYCCAKLGDEVEIPEELL